MAYNAIQDGLVLSSEGDGQQKVGGNQSTGAKHPWYQMAPGNKFDLASDICKSVRQTYIFCQITNVDAIIELVFFNPHRWRSHL